MNQASMVGTKLLLVLLYLGAVLQGSVIAEQQQEVAGPPGITAHRRMLEAQNTTGNLLFDLLNFALQLPSSTATPSPQLPRPDLSPSPRPSDSPAASSASPSPAAGLSPSPAASPSPSPAAVPSPGSAASPSPSPAASPSPTPKASPVASPSPSAAPAAKANTRASPRPSPAPVTKATTAASPKPASVLSPSPRPLPSPSPKPSANPGPVPKPSSTTKPSPSPTPAPARKPAASGSASAASAPDAVPSPKLNTTLWRDSTADMADRVDSLLASLTLEEKVTQFGSYQQPLKRLGIPGFQFWTECLHGHQEMYPDRGVPTVFPQPLVLAATFDPDLAQQVYTAISDELRAKANAEWGYWKNHKFMTCWSPHINIFRDPRWGRGSETFGEDPYLTSRMAVAAVNGLQGNDTYYTKIVATCKHFLGYSLEMADGDSRFNFNANLSPQDLLDTYAPAFQACVTEGGAQGVMCSYNAVNGTPACANPAILQTMLRQQWGFQGYVVTDCNAVSAFVWGHHTSKSRPQAAAAAIKSGSDLLCDEANNDVMAAVQGGLLQPSDIDTALRRTFMMRFKTGQFDPFSSNPWGKLVRASVLQSPRHIALARQVARRGIVMLRNNGLLPLSKSISKLCVVGPFADSKEHMMGNYYGVYSNLTMSPVQAIRIELGNSVQVTYARGMDIMGEQHTDWPMESALQNCGGAAAGVVMLGSPAVDNGNVPNYIRPSAEGEGQDRGDLYLPGRQLELLKALVKRAPNLPLVVVLTHGGPLDVSWMLQQKQIGAILSAGYPGQEGSRALTEILFGKISPSGRLPVTWYYNNYTDAVAMSDMRMRPDPASGYPGRTYRFLSDPSYIQFPFGYGLSYTTFDYTNLVVVPADKPGCTPVTTARPAFCVAVTVVNVGDVAGEEVVMMYISHSVAAGNKGYPLVNLRGSQRTVLLQPNQRQTVRFELSAPDFIMPRQDGTRSLHVGAWNVIVGQASTTVDVQVQPVDA